MTEEQEAFDWSVATFEGSRLEQYRRWSKLDFTEILTAQEEMAEIAKAFGHQIYEGQEPPQF